MKYGVKQHRETQCQRVLLNNLKKKAPEQQLQAFSSLFMDKKMKLSKLAQSSILKKEALILS